MERTARIETAKPRLLRGKGLALLPLVLPLRTATYVLETGKLSRTRVLDALDDEAWQLVLVQGDRSIGAARVLSPTVPLEIEGIFAVDRFRERGPCVEVNRLCLLPEARSERNLFRMMIEILDLVQDLRTQTILATATPELAVLYQSIGFQVFSDPVFHPTLRGEHVGLWLDLAELTSTLKFRRPRLYEALRRAS